MSRRKGKRCHPEFTRKYQGSTCGNEWVHLSSGWRVAHCGHPTALWPYYPVTPHGTCLPKTWARLYECQLWVLEQIEKHKARYA